LTAKILLTNKEDPNGVTMRYICEKCPSHSEEEIRIVPRELFDVSNSSVICQSDILKIHKSALSLSLSFR
jgi:hypothetical protein